MRVFRVVFDRVFDFDIYYCLNSKCPTIKNYNAVPVPSGVPISRFDYVKFVARFQTNRRHNIFFCLFFITWNQKNFYIPCTYFFEPRLFKNIRVIIFLILSIANDLYEMVEETFAIAKAYSSQKSWRCSDARKHQLKSFAQENDPFFKIKKKK